MLRQSFNKKTAFSNFIFDWGISGVSIHVSYDLSSMWSCIWAFGCAPQCLEPIEILKVLPYVKCKCILSHNEKIWNNLIFTIYLTIFFATTIISASVSGGGKIISPYVSNKLSLIVYYIKIMTKNCKITCNLKTTQYLPFPCAYKKRKKLVFHSYFYS